MDGAFGYFPTYTLGAMAAAQIYRAAELALPDLTKQLGQGDFRALMNWLVVNVHALGRFHASTDDLLRALTGAPLDGSIFREHLEKRYLAR